MIPPAAILDYLSAASERAMPLSILWHAALAVLLVALITGWRPQIRTFGTLLAAAFLSVAAVAAAFTNPFNAVLFLALSGGTLGSVARATEPLRVASAAWTGVAMMMLAFAWVYPHFLPNGSWLRHAYAAPLGTIPCPTLAAAAGLLLLAGNLPRTILLIVAAASLFYGSFGAVYLGVTVDWILTGGGLVLLTRTVLESQRAVVGTRSNSRRNIPRIRPRSRTA